MATWKRRKNWAWPDWTYFFGSILLSPLLNILLGHPLGWMDSCGYSRSRGKPSDMFGFVVLALLLFWLDPIGRILGIPGDEAFEKPDGTPKALPKSRGQQAVTLLWIAICVTAAMGAGVAWVVHLSSAPGSEYNLDNHEAVFFLLVMGALATLVLWLSALGMWVGSRQDAAEERRGQ